MVVQDGNAPSIAGCRPAVILFHHQTKYIAHELNFNLLYGLCRKMVGVAGNAPTLGTNLVRFRL